MKYKSKELVDVIVDEISSDLIQHHRFLIPSIYYTVNPEIRKTPWSMIRDGKLISLNRHGFRSPEPSSNPDFLFSGCSVTYGWGLDIEDLWYEKIIKSVGGSYSSVAMHGDSVTAQVLKIFAYIKEYGNPKNIIALFPDFDRFLTYNNAKMIATREFHNAYDPKTFDWARDGGSDSRTTEYLSFMLKNTASVDPNQSKINYFKRPLIADQVISQEISHMYAAQMINMLSQYCDVAGIKFIWSTWDSGAERVINKIKNEKFFKEYIDMKANNWLYDPENLTDKVFDVSVSQGDYGKIPVECHKEYSDSDTFHMANDRSLGIEHAHFGSHRHIHYYEAFLEEINRSKI